MNTVCLMGRLCADPNVNYTQQNNTCIAQFNLAVDRDYTKSGEEKKADFITIVAYKNTAEFCSKYLKKGQQIGLTGRLQTRNYDDKDGKRVYVTEVVAEHVYFADSKQDKPANPFGIAQAEDIF